MLFRERSATCQLKQNTTLERAGGARDGSLVRHLGLLCLLAAMLIVPAGLTLSSVEHPGVLSFASDNPTP
jgi:hypothetical protein